MSRESHTSFNSKATRLGAQIRNRPAQGNLLRSAIAGCALIGILLSATAQGTQDEANAIRIGIARKIPGESVVSVTPTPMKGIYEVVLASKKIIYTDASSDFVLAGNLFDVPNGVNLTEQRMAALNPPIELSSLPFEHAIKTVKGNGSRKIVIFSDPDCPYCRRLERESLSKLDNVTVYTFLFPLDQHLDANRKANLIWCAHDRAAAWRDWMLNGTLPAATKNCTAPLEASEALGRQLGVRATPTLFFPNGRHAAGFMSAEDLELKLKS